MFTPFLGYIDPGTGFTIFGAGAWFIASALGLLGIFSVLFKKTFKFFRKHKRKISVTIVLLLILLGLAKIGVMIMTKESTFNKKIIVLGFDGLSPEIIELMMSEGKLPYFSRLKEQGSYRRLTTTNPSQSPVAWAGFATGQNPGKTGIFDFIIRNPQDYKLSLSLAHLDKGKPGRVVKSARFWQYASEKKIPVIIISCPLTFPPDKVYGRMLSGMGVPDILGTEGTFTFYTTETLDKTKDIGGNVFRIKKSPIMILDLIGPRVATLKQEAQNVKVPFKVILQDNKKSVIIEYQNNKLELPQGQWSGWTEVTFKAGLKKIKGIFKFYLVEIEPEFKLYIRPINFDPRAPLFPISYPNDYSKELATHIGLFHTQGMPANTWAVNEKRLTEEPLLEQIDEIFKEKTAMLEYELDRFKKGVLFCYFEEADIIQHMFWRYRDPQHPLYEKDAPQEYKEKIETWYKKLDKVLGMLLDKIGRQDTIIVLSDHGFGTFRRAAHINTWLRQNRYLELKNPYAESGKELLEDIDWERTKAYSIGFGAIYINQEGREREGIVKPGQETEQVKEEISTKLKNWIDAKYNQSVVNNVYQREEIFWGDYATLAPDLYVGFNVGYRASWQTALGAVPKELIEDNLKKWSGDHLFDPNLIPGILLSNRKIAKEKPSIYDITPTILKTIGLDDRKFKECNFDGEPLF